MTESARVVSSGESARVRIETATIDQLADVGVAIDELIELGVTVIATSCDDVSLRAVVDAAIEQSLLAVTGCVTIPAPDLSIDDRLFINLASLDDSGATIAGWAAAEGLDDLVLLSSDLIPDVEKTCASVEAIASDASDVESVSSVEFVELIDDPNVLVESLEPQLSEADAFVVCALPPAVGDVAAALRSAGLEQPILVPWFGELEDWDESTSDVFVFSPSSRHGDDPDDSVRELYDSLASPEALDVVAADTLSAIANAAQDAQSIGSRRIADALRGSQVAAVSGDISVEPIGDNREVIRSYRVLEVRDGLPTFVGVTEAS